MNLISSLQASLILLVALMVCRIGRGRSAAWRSAILTAGRCSPPLRPAWG
jgi:hypothetical protein